MTTSEIRRFFSKPYPVIRNLFPPPRWLDWFGTRADPRGRGPPCVMQANRTPVPMAVLSRPERWESVLPWSTSEWRAA